MNPNNTLSNYIDGQWCVSTATEYLDVINPATAQLLAKVPLSPASEVNQAADAAAAAFITWRRT
ncbi:MAG: aldehyde dehydrogenase family protein, partial [Nostocaceae cyanobacterium]|nr:aldehyde dehydrogenase family protein [Nostocaceae cyanobacterium]